MSQDTISYPLLECTDCAHRQVCKYMDGINKVLHKMPFLDLSSASCEHYVPVDVIDGTWKDYVGDDEAPIVNEDNPTYIDKGDSASIYEALNEALLDVIETGYVPIEVEMSRKTMDMFLPSEMNGKNVGDLKHIRMKDGAQLKIKRNDTINDGFFYITFVAEGDQDETD